MTVAIAEPAWPPASRTVSVAWCVPARANACVTSAPIPVAPSSKAHVSVTGTDGSLLQPTPWNVTPAPGATRLADALAFAVGVGSLNS